MAGVSAMFADLSRSDLSDTDLVGADLTRANLSGADVRRASLGNARLTSAKARGADFTGASLVDADLSNTDLTGAELTGARLDGAQEAAISVFHARAAAHFVTGQALERIADDIGIDRYADGIQPLVDQTVQVGMPVSAPRSQLDPPPISWA